MNLQNAAEGVAKLHKAAIIELVAALCTVIATIMGALAVVAVVDVGGQVATQQAVNLVGVGASSIGFVIFSLGAVVLAVINLVLEISGTNLAKKDETETKFFASAFFCILASLICTIVGTVLVTPIPALGNCLQSIGDIFNIFISWYVLKGVWGIANQIGDGELAAKAQSAATVVAVVIAISLIFKWVPKFFAAGIGQAIGIFLAIVAFVLSIVQIFMYLSVLKRAKESFSRQ